MVRSWRPDVSVEVDLVVPRGDLVATVRVPAQPGRGEWGVLAWGGRWFVLDPLSSLDPARPARRRYVETVIWVVRDEEVVA